MIMQNFTRIWSTVIGNLSKIKNAHFGRYDPLGVKESHYYTIVKNHSICKKFVAANNNKITYNLYKAPPIAQGLFLLFKKSKKLGSKKTK